MIKRISDVIRLLSGWRCTLVTFLIGMLATLALPPYDFPIVCFLSFPILVWLIDNIITRTKKKEWFHSLLPTMIIGWWFGFGYFVAGLWWIGNALLIDGQISVWMVPFAIVGLSAFLAFFYAFAVLISCLLWSDGVGRIFALAFGFGIAEWVRSFILTGFPWNAIGYAAMPIPLLMQSARVVGLYGMNALAVFVFAAPALLVTRQHRNTGLALALVFVAAHIGYGFYRLHNAPERSDGHDMPSVRIIQPSISQDLKWNHEERRAIFEKHIALTQMPPKKGEPKPSIIVWPETSIPYILTKTPYALTAISEALSDGQVLLAGAVREEKRINNNHSLYYNSIYVINNRGEIIDTVDKVHLVPFGEYLPLEKWWRWLGLQDIIKMQGGFTAASHRHSINIGNKVNFLPLICYEAIFPSGLDYIGQKTNAIVNVTNDAWYGDTPGPYQHLRQAQLRAVEQGLPLIRAANSGLSAVVDVYGRIIRKLDLNTIGIIDVVLPLSVGSFWSTAPCAAMTWIIFILLLALSLKFKLSSYSRFC